MSKPQFGDRKFAVRVHKLNWATREHFDFRLEYEGKLWSWASCDPPNLNPYRPIKLFWTNYHQLKYLLSDRIIPEGVPGAGPTVVGDKGVYRFLDDGTGYEQFARGHISIYLSGELLNGAYSLRRVGSRPDDWLWVKGPDNYVDLTFRFPDELTPQKIQELGNKNRINNNFLPFLEGYS